MSLRADVDWTTLDKRKFFVNGAFVFTGLTTCLFPLTVRTASAGTRSRSLSRTHARSHGRRCGLLVRQVIKTRMMALDRSSTASSPTSTAAGMPRRATVLSTAREVVHASGYRGLYKGFSTVVCGLIPGRMMYLTVGVDLSPAGLLARRIVSIIAAAHAPTASSPSHHHRRHHRAIPLVR